MTHLIACVHATPLAVEPVARTFRQRAPEWGRRDIIEERLLYLQGEGEEAFSTFVATLKRAEEEDPSAILTTCSLYTRELPRARKSILKPVLGIDEPMIEKAVEIGGNLALVGSLSPAIEGTANLIMEHARTQGRTVDLSTQLLVDPNICSKPEGVQELAERLRLIATKVDGVVVVQASLSPAADLLSDEENKRILTSPRLAIAKLQNILKEQDG
jgi:Asp/Glu/hydantoin racemase